MNDKLVVRTALALAVALVGMPRAARGDAGAQVVFTFDVSSRGVYERTLPLFQQHAMRAVVYAETAQLNSGESWVMSWDQLRALQNTHGWEIASHTINHPDLTLVSDAQLEQELAGSRDELTRQGLRIRAFATPYGAFNPKVLAAIAKHYASHRAAWGGPNRWPTIYDDYQVRCHELQNTVSLDQARQWVDEAIREGQTLVLLNHELVNGAPAPYEYNIDDYAALLAYVATRPIAVLPISDALRYSDRPNLIDNGSFEQRSSGWATGWQRSSVTAVTLDANARGAFPDATRSAKLLAGASTSALTSANVPVQASTRYALRMYQNAQGWSQGGWAVWSDEFSADGRWLSGQWLGGDYAPRVGNRYYLYQPSNAAVASMHFTIYTESNSQGTLYVDTVDLRALP